MVETQVAEAETPQVRLFHQEECIVALRTPSNTVEKLTAPEEDLEEYSSVQVGQRLFQSYRGDQRCRWLQLANDTSTELTVVEMQPRTVEAKNSTMCVIADKFVIFTGGEITEEEAVGHVEKYDTVTETSEQLASLNEPRRAHSSCSFGAIAYVLCGTGPSTEDYLTTIEKLDTSIPNAEWILMRFDNLPTIRRYDATACVVRPGQILIFGGDNDLGKYIRSKLLFDETQGEPTCDLIVGTAPHLESKAEPFCLRDGVFVAFGMDNDDEEYKLLKIEQGSDEAEQLWQEDM